MFIIVRDGLSWLIPHLKPAVYGERVAVHEEGHYMSLHLVNVLSHCLKVFHNNVYCQKVYKRFTPSLGIKKIDHKYYRDFENVDFGNQTIESLQLCSMLAPKGKNGYYQVVHSVPFCKYMYFFSAVKRARETEVTGKDFLRIYK